MARSSLRRQPQQQHDDDAAGHRGHKDSFCGVLEACNVFRRKTDMQTHATIRNHRAQLQISDSLNGNYMFTSLKNWSAVFDRLVRDPASPVHPHLYELIASEKPCKPHLDIDGRPFSVPGCGTVLEIVERTQELVRRILCKDCGLSRDMLPDDVFVWLHSPNPAKLSLHLVVDTSSHHHLIAYRSNQARESGSASHLARRVAEEDPNGVGLLVDRSIYTKERAMRLMGSTKFGRGALTRLLPVRHPRDLRTFLRSVISVDAPIDRVRLLDVPSHVDYLDHLASSHDDNKNNNCTNIGQRIARDRPRDLLGDKSRIHDLVLHTFHPTARPVTPRVCVDAVRDLVLVYLAPFRAEQYPFWIRVGWVLRRADISVDVWLAFSARCPSKYDPHECLRVWNSMDPENDEEKNRVVVTFGTVLMWASEDCRAPRHDSRPRDRIIPCAADFDAWRSRNARGLTLLPVICSKRRVVHFAYNGNEPCVYGVAHDRHASQDSAADQDDDADSPHIVTCYVDDNLDVYAACTHPDCAQSVTGTLGCVSHRRLGPLFFCSPSYDNPVHVDLRFLQAPDHLPPLERGFLRQSTMTEYLRQSRPDDDVDTAGLKTTTSSSTSTSSEDEHVHHESRDHHHHDAPPRRPRPKRRHRYDTDSSKHQLAFGKQLALWLSGRYKALCIKSPMGTGKSHLLRRLVDEHFRDKSVLVVTYRQTLAFEHQNKLAMCDDGKGFVNYMNVDPREPLHDRSKFPRVVCQYDSLARLCRRDNGGCIPAFDLVVLDEVESLLRHSVSSTIPAAGKQHSLFVAVLEQPPTKVLCLDAFLGDLTTKCLRKMRDMSFGTVLNDHSPTRPRTFRVSNDAVAWTDAILHDLRHDKRLVVPCMSSEQANRLHSVVSTQLPQLLDQGAVVKHDSMQPDSLRKLLVDVERLWGAPNVRLVIYTPTVEAGIDFSVPDHFDRMYVYICRHSCLPLGLVQMTGRVRSLADPVVDCLVAPSVHLGSNCRAGSPLRISADDALAWLRWADTQFIPSVNKLTSDCNRSFESTPHGVRLALHVDPYLLCLSQSIADRQNADCCFLAVLQDLVESVGHRFSVAPALLSKKQAFDRSKECAGPSYKTHVLHSLYVSDDPHELDQLRRRINAHDASEHDKWTAFKLDYLERLGIGDVDHDFLRLHGLDAPSHVSTLLNALLLAPPPPSPSSSSSLAPILDNNRNSFSEDSDVHDLRARFVRHLFDCLGLQHPLDDSTVCADLFTQPLEASPLYAKTPLFRSYPNVARMFLRAPPRDQRRLKWNRKTALDAVNVVLASVGLRLVSLVSERSRSHRSYAYKLDRDHAQRMRELLVLKLRTFPAWLNGSMRVFPVSLDSNLRNLRLRLYAHLLQRRPPPLPPSPDHHDDHHDVHHDEDSSSHPSHPPPPPPRTRNSPPTSSSSPVVCYDHDDDL